MRLVLPDEVTALAPGKGYLCVGAHRCEVRIPQRDFLAKVPAFIPRARLETKPMAFTEWVAHGKYRRVWAGIKDRCDNPKSKHWDNYGGRGIGYDQRWKFNYELFERELDTAFPGGRPSLDYTLDRKDNDQGYFLDNLNGWVDKEAQAQNRRNVKKKGQAVEDE